MRFKMLSLSVLMMLCLASCSEQHLQEDRLASSKVGEQKGAVKAPQDSVLSLLNQARWGDGSAYLKLADCYRDGFGMTDDEEINLYGAIDRKGKVVKKFTFKR